MYILVQLVQCLPPLTEIQGYWGHFLKLVKQHLTFVQDYKYTYLGLQYEQLSSNGNNMTIKQWSTDSKYFLIFILQKKQKT